jgi:hypothetical protein
MRRRHRGRSPWHATAGILVLLLGAAPAPPGDQRTARPDGDPAARARAEALVKDVFKEEFSRADKDRSARKGLAATLLEQGKRIEADDAAVRLVALRQARDLAARAGDIPTAFQAVTELARGRAVNVLDLKARVLADALAALPRGPEATAVAEVALSLAGAAAEAEDFDGAVRLGALAEEAARKGSASALQATIGKRNEQFRVLRQETIRVRPFLTRLRSAPDDPEANLAVGRYWSLFRGRWPQGLPLLARGSDAALRQLARRDLAQPTDAASAVALADGWWDRAGQEQGTARLQMLARCYQWYQQVSYRLEGADRQRVERRLQTLRQTLPPELRLTDIAVTLHRLEGHTAEVLAAALSPDGRQALSGSADRTVRLWDTATGQELRQLPGHEGAVYGVAFAPDGRLAASCGEDHTVRLWDVAAGKEVHRLQGHTEVVNNVAFSPDGRFVASASDDRTVRLWDVKAGREVRRFEGHTQGVYCLTFSPDGGRGGVTPPLLATGGIDPVIRLWDAGTGKEVRRLRGHTGQVLALSFSPDGRRLLSGSEDQTVRLWDVEKGQELRRFERHTASVGGVAFAPDGVRFLSCSDDRSVRLWDADTGKQLRELHGHSDAVYRVVISRDGRLALTCSLDRTLRVWGGPR